MRWSPTCATPKAGAGLTPQAILVFEVYWTIRSMGLTISGLAVVFGARGSTTLALFLALWNVLFNLYLVALQRHNRRRLLHITMRRAVRSPDGPRL